jgi:hypothetical protein
VSRRLAGFSRFEGIDRTEFPIDRGELRFKLLLLREYLSAFGV